MAHALTRFRPGEGAVTGSGDDVFDPAACRYDSRPSGEFMRNGLMEGSVKAWHEAWKGGRAPGAIGSLASTVALSVAGRRKSARRRGRPMSSIAGFGATAPCIITQPACARPSLAMQSAMHRQPCGPWPMKRCSGNGNGRFLPGQAAASAWRRWAASSTASYRLAGCRPAMKSICPRPRLRWCMLASAWRWQRAARLPGVDWAD